MQHGQSWYVGTNGQQQGPMTTEQVIQGIQQGSVTLSSYVFTQGMASWTPIKNVNTFLPYIQPSAPQAAPPPLPGGSGLVDEIDFQIFGEEMQFVEIELDPGEACVSEAGALFYMDAGIELKTIFGDGSGKANESLMDKAMSVGKRAISGESLALTQFTNIDPSKKQRVAFASPYPGRIVPMDLAQYGGTIICQKNAFLVAAKGIKLDIEFQKKLGLGLFGGEGFILQKLSGDGLAFVHAGGFIVAKNLEPGEVIKLDTGCLVAFQPTVTYDMQMVGGIANAVFGGEGLFMATLQGPGTVWLQSLPFSRLAGKVWAAAPQNGGSVGEGSVLGSVGGVAMGGGDSAAASAAASAVMGGIAGLFKK